MACIDHIPMPTDDGPSLRKEEQRAPVVSDAEMTALANPSHDYALEWLAMEKLRDVYEAKITNGELRVVKRSDLKDDGSLDCEDPKCLYTGQAYGFKFCPECGGKVHKE